MFTKKDILIIVIKTVIYSAGLILAAVGASSLTSCSLHRDVKSFGRGTIITHDTITTNRGTNYNYGW